MIEKMIKNLNLKKYNNFLQVKMHTDITIFDEMGFDKKKLKKDYDLIAYYADTIKEFEKILRLFEPEHAHDVIIVYPKSTSKKYKSEVNRDTIIKYWKSDITSLRPNKNLSIDEDFSLVVLTKDKLKEKKVSQRVSDYDDKVDDLIEMLESEKVFEYFMSLTHAYRRNWARYIYSAQTEKTRTKRIEEMKQILAMGYKSIDTYRASKK